MKRQFALLIGILLAACSSDQPTLSSESQLATVVANTLTAQPPSFTPIPTFTPGAEVIGVDVFPTGDAPFVSDVRACSPGNGLILFQIAEDVPYRTWDQMYISIDGERVICNEPPGEASTLTCELPTEVTYPALVTFAIGDGIAGTFTFDDEKCLAAEFPPTLAMVFTVTNAQNVNLRTNPGLLFPVSRVMTQGTKLQALGMSAGGDWAYMRTNEGVEGWVDLTFVNIFPKAQLPVIEPSGVYVIKGSVINQEGVPMKGINFAITRGDQRTDAKTNSNGEFHAYLPASATGTWNVGYTGFDANGNTMTLDCALDKADCGKTVPLSVEVTLPTDVVISFGWE